MSKADPLTILFFWLPLASILAFLILFAIGYGIAALLDRFYK